MNAPARCVAMTGTHIGWSPSRDRAAQQRFRNALIRRSGGRCEYPGCPTTTDLHAHHDKAGFTADCGRLLCAAHHRGGASFNGGSPE